jgi:copper homeostasis protein (lipoprotein)
MFFKPFGIFCLVLWVLFKSPDKNGTGKKCVRESPDTKTKHLFIMKKFLFILAISSLIVACRTDKEEQAYEPSDPTGSFGHVQHQTESALGQGEKIQLSEVYTGSLPCPDCEKIEMTVRLNSDSTYFVEEIFHGKKEGESKQHFYNFGRWSLINDSTVWLRGGSLGYSGQSAMWFLKYHGKDSLRMLGKNMEEPELSEKDLPQKSFILTASDKEFKPTTPFKMSGIYSMKDGKAVFRECVTQKTFMIAQKEGFKKAADQYEKLKKAEPGVFAIVMGYLVEGSGQTSGGMAKSDLVITEVLEFDHYGVCEPIEVETPKPVNRESY